MNERLVLFLMDNEKPPAGYVEVVRTRGWEVRGGEVRHVVAWVDPTAVDLENEAIVTKIKETARVQDEQRYKAHAEGRYTGFSDGTVSFDRRPA